MKMSQCSNSGISLKVARIYCAIPKWTLCVLHFHTAMCKPFVSGVSPHHNSMPYVNSHEVLGRAVSIAIKH